MVRPQPSPYPNKPMPTGPGQLQPINPMQPRTPYPRPMPGGPGQMQPMPYPRNGGYPGGMQPMPGWQQGPGLMPGGPNMHPMFMALMQYLQQGQMQQPPMQQW
jgi:hypothetical protein